MPVKKHPPITRRFGRAGQYDGLRRIEKITITPCKDGTSTGEEIAALEGIAKRSSLDASFSWLEALARDVLAAAELPTEDGTFDLPNREEGRENTRGNLLALVRARGYGPLEPESKAADVLFYVKACRGHIGNGNAESAAWCALQAQQAAGDILFDMVEEDVVIRRAQRIDGKKGERYTDEDKARWEALARDYFERNPRAGRSAAARYVREETGLPEKAESSIRKHLTEAGIPRPKKPRTK